MWSSINEVGGPEVYKEELWKMIAFACRYGHQNLLSIVGGAIDMETLHQFNRALRFWIEKETEKGRTYHNAQAEGWG